MSDIITTLMHSESFNDTDRRPKNWREYFLYMDPNGEAPLTAITGLMKPESTDDPEFYWWEKILPAQRAEITGVYTNSGLSTAYNPATYDVAADEDDSLYIKMSTDDVGHFRVGHTVLMRDDGKVDSAVGVMGIITEKGSNYVKVSLLEDDLFVASTGDVTTTTGSYNHAYLEFADSGTGVIWVTGDANAEGATSTAAIMYEPSKVYNNTQIFRTSLNMTRTAQKTRLRTGDQVKQAKDEALKMHSMKIEKSFIFGIRKEWTDATLGTPVRTTAGILNQKDKDGNKVVPRYYYTDTAANWIGTIGWNWMFARLEELFRYGAPTRLGYCGSSALMAMNLMGKASGQVQLEAASSTFGMQFTKVITPFGDLMLKTHPLFNFEPSMRKAMLILQPDNLKLRTLDDTRYLPEIQENDRDGSKSEFLSEIGLETHFGQTHMFLDNLGG